MDKKRVFSWVLYDVANSAYYTTVMAGFFPIFFERYWSNPEEINISTFYLGLSNSIGSLIVALISPFLGAIADRLSSKKKFLFIFSYMGILSCASLYLVSKGDWKLAATLYILANVGIASSLTFYNSLLPSISNKDNIDFISSLGYSAGYLGGALLFLLNVLMYQFPKFFGISNSNEAIKLSFLSVSIWWLVFSIPVFLFVPEPIKNKLNRKLSNSWIQLKTTFKDIKKLKVVGLFLVSYWFYMDGIDTIIRMAIKVGSSMGFEASDMILALLLVNFIGFPSAILFNWFAKRILPKNAVLVGIAAYSISLIFSYFMTTKLHFYLFAILIGLFQGGIQAISRSLFARLIPDGKEAEFFGFYNMLGKFAAVVGPVLLGTVSLISGDVRLGLLSILILFIIGGLILTKVDFDEGERLAKNFNN